MYKSSLRKIPKYSKIGVYCYKNVSFLYSLLNVKPIQYQMHIYKSIFNEADEAGKARL
jgi:hypothetical protein